MVSVDAGFAVTLTSSTGDIFFPFLIFFELIGDVRIVLFKKMGLAGLSRSLA